MSTAISTSAAFDGGMDAAADVGDVLEPGADPGRAVEQRQRHHPLVVAPDAGHGPERLRAAAGGASRPAPRARRRCPPGTPNTRLIRIGGGRIPSSSQRTALTTWPDVERLDLERDPRRGGALDDPAPGRRRGDEGLVAEVHRAGLDARDVGLCLEAGGPLLDRHVVGAARRDHRQQIASRSGSARSRPGRARGARWACRRPRARADAPRWRPRRSPRCSNRRSPRSYTGCSGCSRGRRPPRSPRR